MSPRPKDRKAQIARASADAFSALGYHGVTMEDIASRVGISATALYRHYSGKYELFRLAVLNLGQQLVDATAFADESDAQAVAADPWRHLGALVAALTDTALANRESGGLYRWEARFLSADDQAELNRQLRTVHRRIQRPLAVLHPDRTSRERWVGSTAILSVLGSIVDHRARLPVARMRTVLSELAKVIATAELAAPVDEPHVQKSPTSPATQSKYEALLDESMRLFNERGYRETSVEEIAATVGLPASGVYRYFGHKSDLLAASFRRAADWLSAELSSAAAVANDPEEALTRVIDAYVARSFDRPELDYVYYTERLNMTEADQNVLRILQLSTVESWVQLVVAVRPEWSPGDARFAVHAAMALVIDMGRLTEYRDTAQARVLVGGLLDLTLLGRYRLRATLTAR
ncbi:MULTISPECIES: TetR/AcrR family transcriptional regulator [unclassified Mycobacterium]|uniref:TetR/AcrR family transcriptional regulator n=1 Tax=unclassified Mycobacterium TaxID=2642494 RepID=UPI0029C6EA58|nr:MULTISPECIES: TetR/AcrR family transcriptional regulator [unclassified Mycobacterium]